MYIKRKLETEYDLLSLPLPPPICPASAAGAKQLPLDAVFISDDALVNNRPIIVLVQGSGTLRCVQRATENCLVPDKSGLVESPFPYLDEARRLGCSIVYINTDGFRSWGKVRKDGQAGPLSSSIDASAQHVGFGFYFAPSKAEF